MDRSDTEMIVKESTEKFSYMDKVQQIQDPKMKTSLSLLMDMGLIDFEKNYAALIKVNGEITAAMDDLMKM